MSVTWTWHGAVTPTSVRVRARVDGTSAELQVSENSDLSGAVVFGPVSPDAVDMASVEVTGLQPSTRYHYRWVVDSTPEPDYDGTFLTAPPRDGTPQSFTIGAAGDAGLTGAGDDSFIADGVSNNDVFDTMRARARSEGWLFFAHLGDFFYRDGQSTAASHFRGTYDDVLTFNGAEGAAARQGRFFRSVNMTLGMDDHDLMANNTDRTSPGRDPALEVYRESAPHYRLPAGDGAEGIYQAWRVGRVQFIQSDVRADRDPNGGLDGPDKTMLGAAQKHWMENVLRNSQAEALVWIMPSLWMSDVGEERDTGLAYSGSDYSHDSWWRFASERAELVQMLGDHGWLPRMVQLTADKHALSISSGPANPWGHFPVFMCASMDSGHSANPEGQYDIGQSPGRRRYGTLRVQDSGHTIALHGTGYIGDTAWRSYTAYAHVASRVLALDYAAGQVTPPLNPIDDDQRTLNDYTAQRRDGGERRREQSTGAMSVQDPPDGVGRYTGSDTFDTNSDEALADQAGWRIHRGTHDEARYPSIQADLADEVHAGVRTEAAALDVGDRVTIDNPPGFLPPGPVEGVVEGYSETIAPNEWVIDYTASPAAPLRVARVAPTVVLNPNPDFEVTTAGWQAVGSDLGQTLDHAVRGEGSARQTPDGTSEVARTRTRLEDSPRVYAGQEYTFTTGVRSAQGHDVDMSVEWLDSSAASISFPSILSATPLPAGEWTQVTGSAIAPEGAHAMRWNINQRPTPAAADELFIDQAHMTNGPSLAPDDPDRADTAGSTLVAAAGTGDTELLVATSQGEHSGLRWVNTEGPTTTHPHAAPLDLRIGGEVVRATAVEPAAWDLFRRPAESGTWATSQSGHAWIDTTEADTVLGTGGFGQYGFVRLTGATGTMRQQRLDLDFDVGDCEIVWSVRLDQIASGSPLAPALLLRRTTDSDFYLHRMRLETDGAVRMSVTRGTARVGDVEDPPGLTYTTSSFLADRLWVRTRIVGHRILGRAWRTIHPDGVGGGLDLAYQEPAYWQIDRTIGESDGRIAAGQIGFVAHTFSNYTGTDPEMRFQLVSMETPQRMTATRGINGVTSAHEAGAPVSLARPAVIGL